MSAQVGLDAAAARPVVLPPGRPQPGWRRLAGPAKTLLVVAVCVGGLWTATHGLAGVTWHEVGAVIGQVAWARLGLLAVVWLGGLVVYSTVLAGSLPGLGVRRGLLLNLTGSAVSNVLPLGGAVGTALNWKMLRSWGHSHQAFASYYVLTNALDVLSKLVLPPLAVAGLIVVSAVVPGAVWTLAVLCLAALGIALLLTAVAALGLRLPVSLRERRAWTFLSGVLEQVRHQLLANWERLLPGSVGYVAAQVLLLVLCLRAVGLDLPLTTVLMAAAIERAASIIPLTPGGTGFAEVGTIAWLVTSGVDPAAVVAGVLLYRVFLVALEVPVGGGLLTVWAWLRRREATVEAVG